MNHKHVLSAAAQQDIRLMDELPVIFKGMLRAFKPGERNGVPSVHDTHELNYLRKGSAKWQIGGRTYTMLEGQAVVIKPHVTHSFIIDENEDEDAEMVVLYFDFTNRSELRRTQRPPAATALRRDERPAAYGARREREPNPDETPLDAFLHFISDYDLNPDDEPCLMLHGRESENIAAICERLLEEERHNDLGKEIIMQAQALELLVVFTRALHEQWEESLKVQTGKAQELVEIARDFIELNYTRNISVSDIAGHVFLSTGYFARAFREVMDISPMNYLTRLRVEKACELLAEDDLKISAIATQVGFSSPQRFNAAFRKLMDRTPMDYRKEHVEAAL